MDCVATGDLLRPLDQEHQPEAVTEVLLPDLSRWSWRLVTLHLSIEKNLLGGLVNGCER